MKIKIIELEKLIRTTLLKKFDEKETNLIADVILFGELSGKTSHGIVRLIIGNYSVLAQKPTGKPKFIKKSKLSTIIEANNNPGMLVGALAMKRAIKLAKENGFGLVGTKGSFSSSGCLSYYLEKVAKENLIAIIMAQSPLSTAPYGGLEPLFGTNPISFGIPANPRPLIFDMGTSAISFGAILKAKALGQKLPKNVAVDKEGNVTTDPNKAIEGATLTFDNSYKGSGLAMMVEVFAGLWPGADFVGKNEKGGWGNLFMAFSPNLLIDVDKFKEKARLLVETVRNSKTKDGIKVRISGEKTINTRNQNLKRGEIEVDKKLIEQIKNFIEKGER